MLRVDGKVYYKVSEVAVLSGVNARTLRRWIDNGELDHFLFPYRQDAKAPLYYRLEPPDETDQLWDKERVYRLPLPLPTQHDDTLDVVATSQSIDEHIERMMTNGE